jgi:hypothetical protein
MGRMLSFAARIKTDYNPEVIHAIWIDEQTALLLDIKTGEASTVGIGKAYICSSSKQPETCKDGVKLTFQGKNNFIYWIF